MTERPQSQWQAEPEHRWIVNGGIDGRRQLLQAKRLVDAERLRADSRTALLRSESIKCLESAELSAVTRPPLRLNSIEGKPLPTEFRVQGSTSATTQRRTAPAQFVTRFVAQQEIALAN